MNGFPPGGSLRSPCWVSRGLATQPLCLPVVPIQGAAVLAPPRALKRPDLGDTL